MSEPTETRPYDVVIVGGRVAGASLAARLGARGARVLVLDRATVPSLPQVPSSPIIHPGTMRLLDELGIDETRYGDAHARMTHFAFEFASHFEALMKVPEMFGRDYLYGVDRKVFDAVLWEHLARFPTVHRREAVNVTDLVHSADGGVVGVIAREHGGPEERILARCVVGADGRFSAVARHALAPVVEEEAQSVSTVYYADWVDVAPFRPGLQVGHIHATGRGLDVLFFAMPDGRYSINTHERADRVHVDGDAQGYYEGTLRRLALVWRRLEHARRTSDVIGIKRIGNGYRQAGGPGWVLVGDALHYKDPVDGQGIYDALISARCLDEALGRWLDGGLAWDAMVEAYSAAVRAETHAMFEATCGRLRRELYQEPPVFVAKTFIRWTLTDPVYQDRFIRLLGRAIPADGWPPSRLVRGAVLRGMRRDVRRAIRRTEPAPTA